MIVPNAFSVIGWYTGFSFVTNHQMRGCGIITHVPGSTEGFVGPFASKGDFLLLVSRTRLLQPGSNIYCGDLAYIANYLKTSLRHN